MKLRSAWLLKAVGFSAALTARLWLGTLRYRYRPIGPNMDPTVPGLEGRYIYAMWHEYMLMPAYQYAKRDFYVLISQHADGQLISEIGRHLGFRSIRGSSTRGGVEAVRQMLRTSQSAHLAITPDGPQGPRRRVQPGIVYLAARTGLPIVPTGWGFQRPWRVRSWDRLAVPRPWTLATCVTTTPIVVPSETGKAQFEEYRQRVEAALCEASNAAEHWADTGRWVG